MLTVEECVNGYAAWYDDAEGGFDDHCPLLACLRAVRVAIARGCA